MSLRIRTRLLVCWWERRQREANSIDGGERWREGKGRDVSIWSAQPLSASLRASSVKDTLRRVNFKYHTRELVCVVWLLSVCMSHKAEYTIMFLYHTITCLSLYLCEDLHWLAIISIILYSLSLTPNPNHNIPNPNRSLTSIHTS